MFLVVLGPKFQMIFDPGVRVGCVDRAGGLEAAGSCSRHVSFPCVVYKG